ncbi:MAG: PepSY domain-containing protein [Sphingomicrobium sp.]
MTLLKFLSAAVLAAGLSSSPALADPRRDSDRAFEAIREGRSMPLPELERKVLPFMGGADYLGPELNGGVYRFKFIQDGRVIWVDVDARSGRILRRSRPR